jgi:hypothetical protein
MDWKEKERRENRGEGKRREEKKRGMNGWEYLN